VLRNVVTWLNRVYVDKSDGIFNRNLRGILSNSSCEIREGSFDHDNEPSGGGGDPSIRGATMSFSKRITLHGMRNMKVMFHLQNHVTCLDGDRTLTVLQRSAPSTVQAHCKSYWCCELHQLSEETDGTMKIGGLQI